MKKIVLLLFLINSLVIFAQSSIKLGFRSEIGISSIKINQDEKINPFLLPMQNLSFILRVKLNENNSIDFSPSYILLKNDFKGWETGINWNYMFTQLNIYSSLGYYLHFNSDNTGGNSGGVGNSISFVFLRVGYQLTKIMSLEVSFHIPLDKNYGNFFYDTTHYNHNINYIAKLGVSFKLTK